MEFEQICATLAQQAKERDCQFDLSFTSSQEIIVVATSHRLPVYYTKRCGPREFSHREIPTGPHLELICGNLAKELKQTEELYHAESPSQFTH